MLKMVQCSKCHPLPAFCQKLGEFLLRFSGALNRKIANTLAPVGLKAGKILANDGTEMKSRKKI